MGIGLCRGARGGRGRGAGGGGGGCGRVAGVREVCWDGFLRVCGGDTASGCGGESTELGACGGGGGGGGGGCGLCCGDCCGDGFGEGGVSAEGGEEVGEERAVGGHDFD